MVRSKGSLRCCQLAILTTGVNLVLSFMFVYYAYSRQATRSKAESRFLLSVPEYTGDPGIRTVETDPPAVDLPADDLPPPKGAKIAGVEHSDYSTSAVGVLDFNPMGGVFDKFRMFKTHAFAKTGSHWEKLAKRQVCLGAQTSVDRLFHLVELVSGWSGQLALAVFTPDIELTIAEKYIKLLTSCFPAIKQQVSFHLVEPADHLGLFKPEVFNEIQHDQIPCKDHESYLKQLLNYRNKEMLEWRESYPYPQNLLRNLAKQTCQTNYTYIPDIDMVLPKGMDEELEIFFSKKSTAACAKCVYVVPTFEISYNSTQAPGNKTQLGAAIKTGLARPFHSKLFSINQKSSDLDKWLKIPQTDTMDVAYKMEKYIFKYEPLYIGRGDTPPFDERFIGFGMTRNTQVYEMYVAGYEFYLLNNAFTNHWGFQGLKSRASWRAKQQENNNKKFDEFAKELSAHYGRDPYKMLEKLPKMNLKNIKVAYGKAPSKSSKTSK